LSVSIKSPEEYELLDRRDEEQILAEIKGNIITKMFYSFPLDGRMVTGISWVGTKEIARQYGGIDIKYVRVDETEDSFIAVMKATDTRRGTSLLGTATQPKIMSNRGGEKPDRFAYTKAVSKAQRNAIRAIIPERFLVEMYEQFKEENHEPRRKVASQSKVKNGRKPASNKPSASSDIYLEVKRAISEELPIRYQNILQVSDFNHMVYVQHSIGISRNDFNKINEVLEELGARYDLETNTWEIPASDRETS
jgi:hypothetical protein